MERAKEKVEDDTEDVNSPWIAYPKLPGTVCLTKEQAEGLKNFIDELLMPESVEERIFEIDPSLRLREAFIKLGLLKK